MTTETICFNAAGEPIKVEIRCGHAQPGWYSLTLWQNNEPEVRWEGNFLDDEEDTYQLPDPDALDGRLLHCRAELQTLPPIDDWMLVVTVYQGTRRIGTLAAQGKSEGSRSFPVNLFARLMVC